MRNLCTLLLTSLLVASCTGGGDNFTDASPDTQQAPVDGEVQLFAITVTHSGNSDGVVTSTPTGLTCGATCTMTVPAGATVTLTASPDANTDFTGWSGGGCTGSADCVVVVNADVTIDAAFDLQQFTVTAAPTGTGGGTITSTPTGIDCGIDCDELYDYGASVTLHATPDSGTTFLGWTGGDCTGTLTDCVVDVTADVTIQAAFGLDHSLNVVLGGNGTGTVASVPAGITCGGDCAEVYSPGTMVTLTATATGDSYFDGWSGGGCTGLGTCVVTVDDALAVTATFTLFTHTLDVTVGGTGAGDVTSVPAGIDCGTDCTEDYDSGTDVVLTPMPSLGRFAGWTGGGCTGLGPCTVDVNADKTVGATFDLITVTDVSSTTADGRYTTPAAISIQVTFTNPVVVTGTPTLTLNSGGTATYASGSGTTVLTFTYTVAAGQNSADLDALSTSALALAGGTIRDTVGDDATLTLPTPGSGTSLGGHKAIIVDTLAPTVTGVTSSTANGTYTIAGVINVQVSFSEPVVVTGTPTLTVSSGAPAVAYAGGTGTSTLTFAYTVAAGQNAADLDCASATALALNGGTIKDAATNAATLTVPVGAAAGSLATAKNLVVDTSGPTVTDVTSSTTNGTYGAGVAISLQVTFTEAVTVTGTPTIALGSGGSASYASGSGTAVLTFTYNVGAGQNTADLDYAATTSLALSGGSIKDGATNNATLTLPPVGGAGSLGANKNLVIDTAVPTVTGVTSSTANGSYGVASAISIQVGFSENVTVTGTPALALNSGGSASYASGSGTSTLTFTYTVAGGQNAADLDYGATTSLTGTIKDAGANSAALTLAAPGALGSLGNAKNLVIDTVAPTVSGVTSSTANGTYGVAGVISIQVGFSEPVTVTGTPTLTLNTGATIAYASGTGTATLTFTYTVGAAQNTADLDYSATSSLTGTIKDAAANSATLTLPTVGGTGSLGANKAIVIDTAGPTVSGVTSSTANGSYAAASAISIQVTFTEAVTVTGTPTLALNAGGAASASYASGSGTTVLTFTYTVAAGQNSADLDYSATSSLAGTIKDGAGNTAGLTLPAVGGAGSLGGSKAIVIDTQAGTVTNVTSSTTNGAYKAAAAISIQVTFSEAMTVTGTPTLALNSSGSAAASYASGSGTATLTFAYTVAAGETSADLDYDLTSSLAGTIKDAAGNAATLTLATPGAAGSLGANKSLVIDTTAPAVTGVTSSTANGSYNAASAISIQVTFTEPVTVTGTPTLALDSSGSAAASYASGSGTTVLTFGYTVAAGETSADLDYDLTSSLTGTIGDAATNPATLTLATPGTSGSLGFAKNLVIDTTAPTVTGVTSTTANGSYGVASAISIQVGFSENVTVTGTPTLALNSGATVNYASGSGTASLTFTYTVAAGQNAADLDYVATSSLSGTIRDGATNAATLTLATPGNSGSLGLAKNLVIDTAGGTVTNVTSSTTNGTYGVGAGISIQVTFSEAATVTGTPTLALDTGTASYTSGSGTTVLTFAYTVGAGQNDADLDYTSTAALSGTIKDGAGNSATLTLPALGAAGSLGVNKNLAIDTAGPIVTGVTSSTSDGAYAAGGAISIQVTFSEPAFVTATPTLALNSGATVNYSSGSGTTVLTFAYTVAAGQNSLDLDYTSTAALAGTIKDAVANTAGLGLPTVGGAASLGGTKSLIVDTTAPTVTLVTSSSSDGTYGLGTGVSIQVSFSEAVAVVNTPTLAVNSGATVSYGSGGGTATLTFPYTVAAGQNALDLEYTSTGALSVSGASIKDAAGNTASVTLPAINSAFSLGGTKNLVIDTNAPVVVSVTSPNANGTYRVGSVSVTVNFNEIVSVSGSPILKVSSGGTAVYASGSGSTTLTFTYTLVNGQNSADLDENATTALSLNGGAIKDLGSNAAVLTLPAPQGSGSLGFNKNLVIDTGPIVTDVDSFATDGTYGTGDQIQIVVRFNETINVAGIAYMYLNSGGIAVQSDTAGSNLYLNYSVVAGQSTPDLDALSTAALQVTSAITDTFGTPGTLTVPPLGGPLSIGGHKNLVIVNGVVQLSDGTNEWPDDACNPTNSFGSCGTNAQAYGDAWALYTCKHHGYSNGVWTGTKVNSCGGPESFYCTDGTASCNTPSFERACQAGDQVQIEVICTAPAQATWDPTWSLPGVTYTNNNLTVKTASTSTTSIRTNIGRATGKYYWEISVDSGAAANNGGGLGIAGADWPKTAVSVGNPASSLGFGYGPANTVFVSSWAGGITVVGQPPAGTAVSAGNLYMFALDMDNHLFWIGMNGVWFNNGNPESSAGVVARGFSGTVYPAISLVGSSADGFTANFGASNFVYNPPFGFKAGFF